MVRDIERVVRKVLEGENSVSETKEEKNLNWLNGVTVQNQELGRTDKRLFPQVIYKVMGKEAGIQRLQEIFFKLIFPMIPIFTYLCPCNLF